MSYITVTVIYMGFNQSATLMISLMPVIKGRTCQKTFRVSIVTVKVYSFARFELNNKISILTGSDLQQDADIRYV